MLQTNFVFVCFIDIFLYWKFIIKLTHAFQHMLADDEISSFLETKVNTSNENPTKSHQSDTALQDL